MLTRKLTETKKFGAKRHGSPGAGSPASPRSPQAQAPHAPRAGAPEPTTRNAILSKMAQADAAHGHGGMHGRDIRSKFMNVSKKVRLPCRCLCTAVDISPARPPCRRIPSSTAPHLQLGQEGREVGAFGPCSMCPSSAWI